ncbi:hypothetical protein PG988_007140 [Apiospora saccharicola]
MQLPLQPLSSKPSLAERRAAIQKWLQPTEYLSPGNELMKHVYSHVSGTGSWLRDAPAFQTWSGSAEPSCLAIKGVAGSGKSVFAASTIRQLQQSEPDTPILFFFFRQIVEKNHSAKYLVRDFASQLIPWSDALLGKLEALSESSGVDGIYCVVDALDEMDDEDFDVISRLCSIGNQHDSKARVLLTCRPIPKIQDALRELVVSQLKLDPSLIYPDVAKYVSVSMAALEHTLSPEKEDLVKQTICERAQGLFLHASLERLPRNLTEVYDGMLLEHAKRSGVSREEQARILMCVTHSTRPLRLIELGSLVARMTGTDDLKEGKILVKASCGRLLEMLEDETVSIIHHSFTEFLHDETRGPSPLAFPVLDARSAHAMLAELSLQYLDACPLLDITLDDPYKPRRRSDAWSGSENDICGRDLDASIDHDHEDKYYEIMHNKIKQRQSLLEDMTLNQPLMTYAARNLFYHIGKAGCDDGRLFAALDAYLVPEKPAFAILMMMTVRGMGLYGRRSRPCKSFTTMHLSASEGMTQYFRHISQVAGAKLDQPDGGGRTPLSYASETGSLDIVGHLLEQGANPGSDDCEGLTPLHYASSAGQAEVSKLLLEAGANPLFSEKRSGRYSRGETPLHYACQNGARNLIGIFLRFVPTSEANKCFHSASGVEAVETILEMGNVDVDSMFRGETRLFGAVMDFDYKLMEILPARGADPNKRCIDSFNRADDCTDGYNAADHPDESNEAITLTIDAPDGPTPMHVLAGFSGRRNLYNDDMVEEARQCLTLLLKHGGEINMKAGRASQTPLHYAVLGSHELEFIWNKDSTDRREVLPDMLLRAGADANARNVRGETPLHCASPGSPALVDVLVRNGADIDAVEENGYTPLLKLMSPTVSWYSELDLGIFERLVHHGADVDKATNKGDTVLHMVMMNLKRYAAYDLPFLLSLIRAGGSLSKKNNDGLVPLLTYGAQGSRYIDPSSTTDVAAILKAFVGEGMDINARDDSGENVLWKVMGSFDECDALVALLKRFIGLGADPKWCRHDGTNLLHAAVGHSSGMGCIRFLASCGIDPATPDHEGSSLVHLALCAMRDDYIDEKMEYVHSLVELGASPTARNGNGQSVLHLASAGCIDGFNQERGREHWIDFVLNTPLFACNNVNEQDNEGATAINYAAFHSEKNVARLLKAGADPTLLTNQGMSPLHVACIARQAGTVGLLLSEYRKRNILDQHSNLKTTCPRQRSPLHYACRSGHPESVRYLLKNGADPSLCDVAGYTPLHTLAESPMEQKLWEAAESERRQRVLDRKAMVSLHGDLRPNLPYYLVHGNKAAHIIVGLLDEAGADLNAEANNRGSSITPMDIAIEGGLETMVVELLRRGVAPRQGLGVQLTHEENIEKTVKELVSITDPKEITEAILAQLENGNIDAVGQYFRSSSDLTVVHGPLHDNANFHLSVYQGYTGLIEQFKEEVYKIDYSSRTEETAYRGTLLAAACEWSDPNLHGIKTLVEIVGVDVNAVSSHGDCSCGCHSEKTTALHILAKGSHFWQIEALEYLLKQGADISALNSKGQTPLLAAISTSRHDGFWKEHTIQILLEHGSDPNTADSQGVTCLEHADNSEAAQLMFQYDAVLLQSPNALSCAVQRRDAPLVEVLLENGADSCKMTGDKLS